jgi:23S rRNA pseudouridine2457 synthase
VLIALHKPYGVLSQFTPDQPGQRTLRECSLPGQVYPIGRLDHDSEGLILLTDEPDLVTRLLHPRHGHPREYHTQIEGLISDAALRHLAGGLLIQGQMTRRARAWALDPAPAYPPRDPPIRVRKSIPDSWLALELTEGRNRQVRRMTAAVGLPTLRLIRARIGALTLGSLTLSPGHWAELTIAQRTAVFDQP